MNKYISRIFISNIKKTRISLGIIQYIIDLLLEEYNLVYTGMESNPKAIISLDLAKRVSELFGKEIEYFLNENCELIPKNKLPGRTQDFLIKNQTRINEDAAKNKLAASVILYLEHYNQKELFANSDILPFLPTPLNQLKSIDWSAGLLKGLVSNTKTYKKNPTITDKRYNGEVYYKLKGPIPKETVNKALKKMDLALLETAVNLTLKKMEEKEG